MSPRTRAVGRHCHASRRGIVMRLDGGRENDMHLVFGITSINIIIVIIGIIRIMSLCIYLWPHLCVCIFADLALHVYLYMCVFAVLALHVYMYMCVCVCMHIWPYTYVCICVYIYIGRFGPPCVPVYVRMYVIRMCVCSVCICMSADLAQHAYMDICVYVFWHVWSSMHRCTYV